MIISPLITHTFIDLFFNKERGLLVVENTYAKHNRIKLFESYGVFDGCEEAAKYIVDNVITLRDFKKITLQPPSLSGITEDVRVEVVDGNGTAGSYIPNRSAWNGKDRFDYCTISINSKYLNDSVNLYNTLMHELIHLYQDYNFRRKNADINANAHRYGYSNVIDSSLTETGLIKTISTMLYYLYDIERGAFIGEMNASVNAVNGITFDSIEHAISYLKNTEVYKNYSQCFANCRHLANTESIDGDTKRLILSKVNSMLGMKFNTYNQFVKWLCQKSFKALEKLDNIIPKIACKKMNISTRFADNNLQPVDDIRGYIGKK